MPAHPHHLKNRLSMAVCALALGAGVDGAPLANAQTSALEEVIVTARKRDENLMDIPESVSAIGAFEVERRNIKGLNKIGLAVPNLNLSMHRWLPKCHDPWAWRIRHDTGRRVLPR